MKLILLQKMGVEIIRASHCNKFTIHMTSEELNAERTYHSDCLVQVEKLIHENDIDLLVLDEVIDAVECRTY